MTSNGWRWLAKAMYSVLGSELRKWSSLLVTDAFIGARYSYVELSDKWCGVAYSPREVGEPVRGLENATPRYLVRLVERGLGAGAASLAIAALNAATMAWIYETPSPPIILGKRLIEILDAKDTDEAVVIGFMRGVLDELLTSVRRVYLVELSDELRSEAIEAYRDDNRVRVLSVNECVEALRRATILVATGSALLYPGILLNQLREATRARERVLLGPTSSFHPRLAALLGFTLVGGVYIDPSICRILRWHVAGGGGVHSLRRGAKSPLIPRFFARP